MHPSANPITKTATIVAVLATNLDYLLVYMMTQSFALTEEYRVLIDLFSVARGNPATATC